MEEYPPLMPLLKAFKKQGVLLSLHNNFTGTASLKGGTEQVNVDALLRGYRDGVMTEIEVAQKAKDLLDSVR